MVGPILIGGDETVTTKSGQKTYGLDRFFSSLYGKPVSGLSFFSLSLISVNERTSYPVMMEQRLSKKNHSRAKRLSKKAPKKRGRPKGSQNKNRRKVELKPYLVHIQTMLQNLLALIGTVSVIYSVLDGTFGNNNALQMVRQCSLRLISKLRSDAALYFPYDGPQKKAGRQQKYGHKLDYNHIPDQYFKETTLTDGIQIKTYQLTMWHKLFLDLLNVVVIVKSQKRSHSPRSSVQ